MIKKSMILLLSLFALELSPLHASNDQPIKFGQLPPAAQQFIKLHFKNQQVAFAKKEQRFMETRYEVMLVSGEKIEFLKNGSWKEVSCMHGGVPATVIPAQMMIKMKELYPDALIIEIDRDSYDYELKLVGGLELTFDLNFNLIDIDN